MSQASLGQATKSIFGAVTATASGLAVAITATSKGAVMFDEFMSLRLAEQKATNAYAKANFVTIAKEKAAMKVTEHRQEINNYLQATGTEEMFKTAMIELEKLVPDEDIRKLL